MKYIRFTLSAPIQSYGTSNSGWMEMRDSQRYPTSSAVAGLIAAALGIEKGTPEYAHLLSLKYLTKPCEKASIFEDFQIVSPREPGKTSEKARFLKCSGDKDGVQRPIKKQYIQDGCFSVWVGSSEKELEDIHKAIRNPKWVYYLGRACCTPAAPIVPEDFILEELEGSEEDYICI